MSNITNRYILSQTVTLTNAQIKALPVEPVVLVPAPGVNDRLRPIAVSLVARFAAGAYTNLNPTYCETVIRYATGPWITQSIPNESTATTSVGMATAFYGAANSIADLGVPWQSARANTGGAGASEYVVGELTDLTDANAALQLFCDNNGSGAFTGGNVANTLKVTVYYVVEPL